MKKQIVLTAILSTFTFFGADVDINGNFMKVDPKDSSLPLNWDRNWKQRNEIGFAKLENGSAMDRRAVRITTETLTTPFVYQQHLPVKPGQILKITYNAKGSGHAGCFFYFFDANNKYLKTEQRKPHPVKKDFMSFETIYMVPPEVAKEGMKDVKAVPAFYTAGVFAYKNSEVVFENIRIIEKRQDEEPKSPRQ